MAHGVTENGIVPAEALVSIFERLAARGFATGAVTGAGLLRPKFLAPLGLPQATVGRGGSAEVPVEVRADEVTGAALEWLDRNGTRPFALWVHYYDPHEPYDPPPATAARFRGDYAGPLGDALSVVWLVGLNRPGAPVLTTADRHHIVDLYDAEIALMDRALGRLFAGLDERALTADTLMVVVADHGQAHGEAGFWGHGERLLEPIIRVALVVRGPGVETGTVVSGPAETLDVVPTLLALFRLPPEPELPGRSLVPALRGELLPPARHRLIQRRSFSDEPRRLGAAVLGDAWKAVYYREADGAESWRLGRAGTPGGLDGDGWEPATPEAELLEAAVARLVAAGPPSPADPAERELLETLGYAN
jgi:arylsulfatase A-like enzyme